MNTDNKAQFAIGSGRLVFDHRDIQFTEQQCAQYEQDNAIQEQANDL